MSKQKLSFNESARIVGKAFKISFKVKSRASLVFSLLGLLTAFLPVLISKTLERFSNDIQALFVYGGNGLSQALMVFTLLAFLYIFQAAFQAVQGYFAETDTLRVSAYVKASIIDNVCSVKYKYINNVDGYIEKVALADSISGERTASCISSTFTWIQYAITFISIFVVLFRINPWIVAVILVTSIPAVVLAYRQNDETFRSNTRWTKEGHMLIHSFAEMVDIKNLAEIRYLSVMDYLAAQRAGNARQFLKKKRAMTQRHVLYNSAADVLRSGVYVLIMLFIVRRIFENPALGIGGFMLAFTLTGQFQSVSASLITSVMSFFSDIFYMKEFFDLEAYEKEAVAGEGPAPDSAEIRFENVDFRYPGSGQKALKNISVHIRQGEKIAIVGENGSGKTTFVNLLCGFYAPEGGSVTISGRNVEEDAAYARRQISVVFQDYSKYEASIKENIVISDSAKKADDSALMDICARVGLYTLVQEQPNKLDETLGIFSDYGKNLSGGQWQKLAIARALYRDSAKIRILDEPTAALDPKAEAEIYRQFSAMTGDNTTILITHRLGAIKVVDRILVFHDGEIVEEGDHERLMAQNGRYAKMYRAQAHWYE